MTDDDYVELTVASNKLANIIYVLLGILVAAYFTFIGIVVWQISDNTHNLLVTVNDTVNSLP